MGNGFTLGANAVSGPGVARTQSSLSSMGEPLSFLSSHRALRAVHTSFLLGILILLASTTGYAQREQISSTTLPRESYAAKASARAGMPPVKRLMGLRSALASEGSRISVASDQPLNDYSAYRDGERFYIVIPHATAEDLQTGVSGPGFTDARVEQRNNETVLSFRLETGGSASVTQKFNRLDIIFVAPGEAHISVANTFVQPTPGASPGLSSGGTDESSNPSSNTGTSVATDPAVAPAPGLTTPAAAADVSSITEVTKLPVGKAALLLPPEKANPLRVPRFEKPPVIDGRLDDDAWKGAAVLKDFYQVEPGDNIAPSKPTEVFIGYDTRFLYVTYHAYDERDKVRATIAKRDAIFDDDYVGLFFDTFNDKRKAYEMNFNPLGVQADGILTPGINEDFSVDMVVESKGSVVDDGYIVEVAIPFKSLR